ncbi:MAG: HEAT repeat domain-containing protein [Acidimicrobiia bacterium]|nr:HEAT repeat domain-containing protein [Acidimicrobiia bacterium]
MSKKDFTTSPPVTGGDAELAAELISNAAYAMATGDDAMQREIIEQAQTALNHPHADVRVSAVGALSQLGSFGAVDLANLLEDPSPLVRRRAVEATAKLIQDRRGHQDSVQGLVHAALNDDPSVSEAAAFAIGEFGPAATEVTAPAIAVLENLASDHPDVLCREAAVAALGALHQGRTAVLNAMSDRATVRRRAVLALAPFAGSDVDAALEHALTDRDWQVRQAAEDQLAVRR